MNWMTMDSGLPMAPGWQWHQIVISSDKKLEKGESRGIRYGHVLAKQPFPKKRQNEESYGFYFAKAPVKAAVDFSLMSLHQESS